jgi:hypothetical protein
MRVCKKTRKKENQKNVRNVLVVILSNAKNGRYQPSTNARVGEWDDDDDDDSSGSSNSR